MGSEKFKLVITRVNVSKDEVAKLSADVAQGIMKSYELDTKKQMAIDPSRSPLNDSALINSINKELRILLPDMKYFVIGKTRILTADSSSEAYYADIQLNSKKSLPVGKDLQNNNLYNFLKFKLNVDTLLFQLSSP